MPVGTRLGVRASLRVCRDRRAGQSGGEEQGLEHECHWA